jgi:hypothetical protein
MNSWYSTHTSAITANSLTTELKVSSWALIVDVATKALAAGTASPALAYNQATNKDTNGNCLENVGGAPAAGSLLPVVGAAGDTWAIAINLPASGVKQPDVIRVGSYVSALGTGTAGQNGATTQSTTIGEESWTGSFATPLSSYTDIAKNTGIAFNFTAKNTCDTKKWASATACLGFEGKWGKNANTWAAASTAGSHRYFLWLADAATDKSKIVSIEDKDVINLAVIEAYANVYKSGATKSCDTANRAGTTEFGLATGTYTKGKGATSTILGASALVAGLIASLF